MSQGGASYGGSHGMGGGGAAAKAATPAPQAAPQTREQQLLARIKGDPTILNMMNDQDALDTVKAIEQQSIAQDGTQNDTFCQRWLNVTGLADEMPEVLSSDAFDKARRKAGAETLYHSDAPYDGNASTAVKTLQQLQTGKTAFASYGLYGSGTYLDPAAVSNACGYAGSNGSQVKMFLNSRAAVATAADLHYAQSDFAESHPKTYQYLTTQVKKLGSWDTRELKTVWLTIAGYNAYDDGPRRYKVAYSRKALTICETIKSKQQVVHGAKNW